MSKIGKREAAKCHMACIDHVRNTYNENGWAVVHTKASSITDLIASKQNRQHYIKVQSQFCDTPDNAEVNQFVQHSMSGQATPVIADVSVKFRQDEGGANIPAYRVSLHDANTNGRVIVSARKPKEEESAKK